MIKAMVLASDNRHKYEELQALLRPLAVELLPQSEFSITSPPETGSTFIENALIKARHAVRLAGIPAIADDSGLVVEALDGAPGIFSARYAGDNVSDADNRQHLLATLAKKNQASSNAFYFCAIVSLTHTDDPTPVMGLGRWHGQIITQQQGIGGFGYDPCFYLKDFDCTVAQLDASQKMA